MNKTAFALAALLAGASAPTLAQAPVAGTITINKPGVYGHIDIGGYTPPTLIYPQPVLIAPPPVTVVQPAPVYLYVPPGHAKDWAKHCAHYHACGQPVYFVDERWVRERYEHEHGHGHGHGHGHDKDHDDDDGDHDHGHGHGHDD